MVEKMEVEVGHKKIQIRKTIYRKDFFAFRTLHRYSFVLKSKRLDLKVFFLIGNKNILEHLRSYSSCYY